MSNDTCRDGSIPSDSGEPTPEESAKLEKQQPESEEKKDPETILRERQDSMLALACTVLAVVALIGLSILIKPVYMVIGLICSVLVLVCVGIIFLSFVPVIGLYCSFLFFFGALLTPVFGIEVFRGTADPSFTRFVTYSPLILMALFALPLGKIVAGVRGLFAGIGAGLCWWWYLMSMIPYMQINNEWSALPVAVTIALLLTHICAIAGLVGAARGTPEEILRRRWPGSLLRAYFLLVTAMGAFLVLSVALGVVNWIVAWAAPPRQKHQAYFSTTSSTGSASARTAGL